MSHLTLATTTRDHVGSRARGHREGEAISNQDMTPGAVAAAPVLILGGAQVRALLEGREQDIVERVGQAYRAHADGRTSVPHSLFLRFPEDPASRIIALPAYLRAEREMAGVKWVSSFPANVRRGLERASAVVILSSPTTGQPVAIMEGSTISARRTAASAALAAATILPDPADGAAALLGCGVVNFEILRFLVATRPGLRRVSIHDLDPSRAAQFRDRCLEQWPQLAVTVASGPGEVLAGHSLISMATTASTPHLDDLSGCPPGTLVLHVSLRDVAPAAALRCDNVTDDADHVCRAETSLHLAERAVGHRAFIRCSLGEILTGRAPARRDPHSVVLFSPFGLGILDLAVATMVWERALAEGAGVTMDDFVPAPWTAAGAPALEAAG
jgi:N-[(2S)-2-amino-2-carboxyethyl]-L-glutamate dehydrogenase